MDPNSSSSILVEGFQKHCTSLVEHYFPVKTVQVSSFDQPFFNDRLRTLRRQRQREYRRSGRSEKYLRIKKSFDEAFIIEAHKYKDKLNTRVINGILNSIRLKNYLYKKWHTNLDSPIEVFVHSLGKNHS